MTSASELFYTRRSRWGRTDIDLGFDSTSSDRHLECRRRHHAKHRRDINACDTFRRPSLQERHHSTRFSCALSLDRSDDHNESGTSLASRNNINVNIRNSVIRTGFGENSRLPGAVLLARERLLERLRGAPLQLSSRNHTRVVEPSDASHEISTSQSPSSSIVDTSSRMNRIQLNSEFRKRPPGLSQEAIDQLELQFFINAEHFNGDELMTRASLDCSICLESFTDGDKLIHLRCKHKFHYLCLDRWIRTCGDCPYCRRRVVVK